MNWKSFVFGIVVSGIAGTVLYGWHVQQSNNLSSLIVPISANPTPKPLLPYSFSSLKQYVPQISKIIVQETMFEEADLTAYLATLQTGGKTMSMQVMIPQATPPLGGFPIILMNRGYVAPTDYQTGVGTKNAARYFASQGFVTVAPDFLGFGQSDNPPADTIEARLERPKQVLDLLASLETIPNINKDKIGLWGHSNGGQISLSILEITGKTYPTVLWAPVTKPFPYSILYFTDDSPDQGKELRRVVAKFEQDYDILDFTIGRSFDQIQAPIQLHQGSADDAVPLLWSTSFYQKMTSLEKDIEYFQYPAMDHNMRPDWNTVASRSLAFFVKHLYGE